MMMMMMMMMMILNDELGRLRKEAVLIPIKILTQHFPGHPEGKNCSVRLWSREDLSNKIYAVK
jgi:hypothetical protein